MSLFNDEAKAEIERLKEIIRKLEESKGVRMATVEIEAKPGYGYLFYITAPTMASELEFGLAMGATIEHSFKAIGLNMRQDFIRETSEPASEREEELARTLKEFEEPKTVLEIGPECYVAQGMMRRWIIVSANYRALAWSGSRWVPHNGGFPAGNVQVSNFETRMEAFNIAGQAGLHVLTTGYKATEQDITCFKCGMTSFNANDVKEKYCGNCHEFHKDRE